MFSFAKDIEKGGDKVETDLKIVLGKAFGELYEIQKKQGIKKVDEGHIFGLLNGFEEALNNEFEHLNFITEEEVNKVSHYFAPYVEAEEKTKELPAFTNMQSDLEKQGIGQARFITILRYLNATNRLNVDVNEAGDFTLTEEVR